MKSEQTNRLELHGVARRSPGGPMVHPPDYYRETLELSRRLDALESREAEPTEQVKPPEDEEAAIGKICSDVESEYLRGHADLHHRWMLYQVARRVLAWQRNSKISDKPT